MPSPVSKCIFCNGSPLTGEHVFADWIKPYIPMLHIRHELHKYSETKKASIWLPKRERKGHRTGNPYSWTVKCVCGPCNSGWMSNDIQTPAKPFLIPLFEGIPTVLDEDAQRRVSAWIALATIVAEFDKRSEKAMPISSSEHVPEGGDPNFPYAHTQTTTFIVGKLYAHVFSCPVPDAITKLKNGARTEAVLSQIWPIIDQRIDWPKNLVTDRDAANIPTAIFNFFRSIPPPKQIER
jgi:hypothetical protein